MNRRLARVPSLSLARAHETCWELSRRVCDDLVHLDAAPASPSGPRDPAGAMTFATAQAATACYRAVPHGRPLRADRKPNRPLTMFSVAF
jgi:hypothetical protein